MAFEKNRRTFDFGRRHDYIPGLIVVNRSLSSLSQEEIQKLSDDPIELFRRFYREDWRSEDRFLGKYEGTWTTAEKSTKELSKEEWDMITSRNRVPRPTLTQVTDHTPMPGLSTRYNFGVSPTTWIQLANQIISDEDLIKARPDGRGPAEVTEQTDPEVNDFLDADENKDRVSWRDLLG